MKGNTLRFYVQEERRHGGKLLYEWLLEAARNAGIEEGSAFRTIAGSGVEFVVTMEQAMKLLELVKRERLQLFYAISPAELGAPGS